MDAKTNTSRKENHKTWWYKRCGQDPSWERCRWLTRCHYGEFCSWYPVENDYINPWIVRTVGPGVDCWAQLMSRNAQPKYHTWGSTRNQESFPNLWGRGEHSKVRSRSSVVSRMESTWPGGKIQTSQSTANALIAAGKRHWLTERPDKVGAKGKGEWQPISSTSVVGQCRPQCAPYQVISPQRTPLRIAVYSNNRLARYGSAYQVEITLDQTDHGTVEERTRDQLVCFPPKGSIPVLFNNIGVLAFCFWRDLDEHICIFTCVARFHQSSVGIRTWVLVLMAPVFKDWFIVVHSS